MIIRCSKQSNYYAIWISVTIINILLFFFVILKIVLKILKLDLATGISPFWENNQWLFWIIIVLIAVAATCFVFIVPYKLASKYSYKLCNAILQNSMLLLEFGKKQTI